MSLRLDPISRQWLVDVQRYASDPAIGATSNVPAPFPEDGAESWYAGVVERMQAGASRVFAIEEQGTFRGVMALNAIDRQLSEAHIDYWVAVPYQRRGIATEAIKLCLDFAGTQLSVAKLKSGCLTRNEASSRALLRNGFLELKRTLIRGGKFTGEEYRVFAREV